MVQNDIHFETLIMQKPFESIFYWTGHDLLDISFKYLCIDKDKWATWKKLSSTSVTENININKVFESSVPDKNWYYSPLCLTWNYLSRATIQKMNQSLI